MISYQTPNPQHQPKTIRVLWKQAGVLPSPHGQNTQRGLSGKMSCVISCERWLWILGFDTINTVWWCVCRSVWGLSGALAPHDVLSATIVIICALFHTCSAPVTPRFTHSHVFCQMTMEEQDVGQCHTYRHIRNSRFLNLSCIIIVSPVMQGACCSFPILTPDRLKMCQGPFCGVLETGPGTWVVWGVLGQILCMKWKIQSFRARLKYWKGSKTEQIIENGHHTPYCSNCWSENWGLRIKEERGYRENIKEDHPSLKSSSGQTFIC